MKKAEARRLLKTSMKWLRAAMMLGSWRINLEWVELPPGSLARVRTDARYQIADIEIDASQHEDEEHLLSTVRHELAHIFHADFKTYELTAAHHMSDPVRNSLEEVFDFAQEKTVTAIEAMLEHGLGLTPKKMISLARRWQK